MGCMLSPTDGLAWTYNCYSVWPASLRSTVAIQISIDYMYIGGNRPALVVCTLCYSNGAGHAYAPTKIFRKRDQIAKKEGLSLEKRDTLSAELIIIHSILHTLARIIQCKNIPYYH